MSTKEVVPFAISWKSFIRGRDHPTSKSNQKFHTLPGRYYRKWKGEKKKKIAESRIIIPLVLQ